MNDSHHHPHDAVVRSVLANGPETGEILPPYLDEDSRRPYRWATLALESGDIVDDRLGQSRSDLLFSVEMVDSDQRAYVLLEHQSTPDRWMANRLRKYRAAIWDRYLRDNPQADTLPPIESIVLYQGREPWPWKPDSTNLFPDKRQSRTATPPMRFALIDQTLMEPEDVRGKPLGRLLQWAMMAVFRPDQQKEIQSCPTRSEPEEGAGIQREMGL